MGRFDLLPKRLIWQLIIISVLLSQAYRSRCCTETERAALLQLKSYFLYTAGNRETRDEDLRSWGDHAGNSSCCLWNRVKCDRQMQQVTQLDLSWLMPFDMLDRNVLNVTLFQPFEKLTSLDLTANGILRLAWSEGSNSFNLSGIKVLNLSANYLSEDQRALSDLVGSLRSVKNLNLGQNGLAGSFSAQGFPNLKQLQVLDLSYNGLNGFIQGQENLKQLRVLDLSYNQLNGSLLLSGDWKQLKELYLSGNQLNGSLLSQGLCNLNNLQHLYLGDNNLSGRIPRCLGHLTSLQRLDLSSNNLSGDIPSSIFSNLTSLKYLSLTQNHFQGNFSLNSLYNHSKLEALILSYSGLQVQIVDPLFPSVLQPNVLGLSDCNLHLQSSRTFLQFLLHQHKLLFLDISHNGLVGLFPTSLLNNNSGITTIILRNNSFEGLLSLPPNIELLSLVYLDISDNQFSGHFPKQIGYVMPTLGVFNASKNSFQGRIPTSIGNMTELSTLDFSNNDLDGEVPRYIWSKCASLSFLMLSNNNLLGDIIPEHMNLTQLRSLHLNNNLFSGTIQSMLENTWLTTLDLSKNEVVGGIPSWLGNLSALTVLSLSNNRLQGHIPSEVCNLKSLELLDLSDNSLTGVIPSSYNLSEMRYLSLRTNFLSGTLPSGLSRSLQLLTLDLSENNFSGFIPPWISDLSLLSVLLLRQNWLEGELPVQLCQLQNINIMDLSSNVISSTIPSCLAKMSFGNRSMAFDISTSELSTTMLNYFTSSEYFADLFHSSFMEINKDEEVVFLTKSRYSGYEGYILGHMSGLDLSCNQLTGRIPEELGRLENIRALNLSHNRLSGSIPTSFSMLRSIESLDLSYNKLSGAIPSQMAKVTTLETFNVSYNNLSGEVPETGQFANFDENNYMGNPFLYGSFLNRRHAATLSKADKKETGDIGVDFDWGVFSWSFGMSGSIAMVACIMVLWINPYRRRTWFQFVEFHVLRWFI